jgi:2-polyprenyl-3-methyl-5-hydroxy-6-metoxy-1,4-benzoquinol methylase
MLKNFQLGACFEKYKEVGRFREAEYQLGLLGRYIEPPGMIFDVGAAAGFFMKVAGYEERWSVEGNEVSQAAIDFARDKYGVKIRYGFLEEIDVPENFYSAVTLWNTLEHTTDLQRTLDKCYRMLKPGGVILIAVPDNINQIHKYYEELHNYEFSPKSLRRALAASGFTPRLVIERTDMEGDPNFKQLEVLYQKIVFSRRTRENRRK